MMDAVPIPVLAGVGSGYLALSANHNQLVTERGWYYDCSANLTLSLLSAATAGAGFSQLINVRPGVTVTLAPNGTDTITGRNVSVAVLPGLNLLECTGSGWRLTSAQPYVNVMDYGAMGDGMTDDTAAIQAAINAAVAAGLPLYFPPNVGYATSYYITSALTVNGELRIFGQRALGGFTGDSVIAQGVAANDHFTINANVFEAIGLQFRSHAGRADSVSGTTTTSFTFHNLVNARMSTIAATTLIASVTPVQFCNYYTNSGNVYRSNTAGVVTAGATLPSFVGGTSTVGGISWTWVSSGTTYTCGQYNNGQVWYYFGVTNGLGGSITGVVPGPGAPNFDPTHYTYTTGGYFVSLDEFSTTNYTNAALDIQSCQSPRAQNCWFNILSGAAVKMTASTAQGIIFEGNVVDGAQYGLYGDCTYALVVGNQLFGCQKSGISWQTGTNAKVASNRFDSCNEGVTISDGGTYGGTSRTTSTLTGHDISGNNFSGCTTPIDLTGVAFSHIRGNELGRNLNHGIKLKNTSFCTISGNKIDGVGEASVAGGTFFNYFYIDGTCRFNSFIGNHLTYANSGQATQFAVLFTSGNEANAAYNFFGANQQDLPAGTSFLSALTSNLAGTVTRFGGSSLRAAARSVGNYTLTPNQIEQMFIMTGVAGAASTLTLDRTAAVAGDYFLIYLYQFNAGSFSVVIKQSGDATVYYTDSIPWSHNQMIEAWYDGTNWIVLPVPAANQVDGASQISNGLKVFGTPSAMDGAGVEITYNGVTGAFICFDRQAASFKPLSFNGSNTQFQSFSVTGLTIDVNAQVQIRASTATSASKNLAKGTAPTSPQDGDEWYDSTQLCTVEQIDGMKQYRPGYVYIQVQDTGAIANTTSRTTLVNTTSALGTPTLPANFLAVGKVVRIKARGILSSTANPNLTIDFQLGGVTVATTGAVAQTGTPSNVGWELEAELKCVTTGAGGTVKGQGKFQYGTAAAMFLPATATAAANTTTTLLVDIGATWGTAAAGNTITCTHVEIEVIG